MTLTTDLLEQLKARFSDDKICVKVASINKDRTRALLVQYLQHTDVADRLDEVDPAWSTEVTKDGTMVDAQGESIAFCHMKLTICGVTRENAGQGQDPKSAASDALKRCAMLFGVGRYLYDEESVWTDYDEEKDRRRAYTIKDYEAARSYQEPPAPPIGRARARNGAEPPVRPKPGKSGPASRTKRELVRDLRRFADFLKYSDRDLDDWARECSDVPAEKMELDQLEKFVGQVEFEARKAGMRV